MVTFIVGGCGFAFGFSLPSSLCDCDNTDTKSKAL